MIARVAPKIGWDRKRLALSFGLALALFLAGRRLFQGNRGLLHAWVDGAWSLASLGAAAKLWQTARRLRARCRHRAFLFLALGAAGWFLGMLLWTASELAGVYTPFPSWADVGFLSLAPCFAAAMLWFNSTRRERIEIKHVADLGIAVCLMILACAAAFYTPLLHATLGTLRFALMVGRPAAFCSALLVGLMCWWQQRDRRDRRVLLPLVLAMSGQAAVATAYTYELATHAYEVGARLDAVWLGVFGLFAWAAFEEDWKPAAAQDEPKSVGDPIDALLPAACLVLILLTFVLFGQNLIGALRPLTIVVAVLLVGLVALREWGSWRIERGLLEQARLERDRFIRAQKMEVVAALAGGVAHDFNNLLMAAKGGLSLARDDLARGRPSEELVESLGQVDHALDQSARLTKRLLGLARSHRPKLQDVDPSEIASRAAGLLTLVMPPNIALETSLPIGISRVRVDPDELEQAILNLGLNARDAMPQGGKIRLTCEVVHEEHATRVQISVDDNGTGMSPELQRRILEPFFTTKSSGAGTGLGLPMAVAFAERHGGELAVESRLDVGSRFVLRLPIL